MRTLSLICIGIAGVGLIAQFAMGDSAPAFILPLIFGSVLAAVFFIFANMVINVVQKRKQYQCVNCGATIRGGKPADYATVCPSCGGSTFR